jgi:hypothetical protein
MNRKSRTIDAATFEAATFEAAPIDATTVDATTIPGASPAEPALAEAPAGPATKLATLIALLQTQEGATIASLCEATGWQSHSVRGAMAGALKRKGHVVASTRSGDGLRRYRIGASA